MELFSQNLKNVSCKEKGVSGLSTLLHSGALGSDSCTCWGLPGTGHGGHDPVENFLCLSITLAVVHFAFASTWSFTFIPDSLVSSLIFATCTDCYNISVFFFLFLINFLFLLYFTLQYYTGFAIHWHESVTAVHEIPNMKPPPISYPTSSLQIIPVYHPQASYILHLT